MNDGDENVRRRLRQSKIMHDNVNSRIVDD